MQPTQEKLLTSSPIIISEEDALSESESNMKKGDIKPNTSREHIEDIHNPFLSDKWKEKMAEQRKLEVDKWKQKKAEQRKLELDKGIQQKAEQRKLELDKGIQQTAEQRKLEKSKIKLTHEQILFKDYDIAMKKLHAKLDALDELNANDNMKKRQDKPKAFVANYNMKQLQDTLQARLANDNMKQFQARFAEIDKKYDNMKISQQGLGLDGQQIQAMQFDQSGQTRQYGQSKQSGQFGQQGSIFVNQSRQQRQSKTKSQNALGSNTNSLIQPEKNDTLTGIIFSILMLGGLSMVVIIPTYFARKK
jgi:hypothetical protein